MKHSSFISESLGLCLQTLSRYFINGFRRNGETTQLMGITFAAENSMCYLLLFPKLASSKRRSEAEEAIKYLQTF